MVEGIIGECGSGKIWRCSVCGVEFEPTPPSYSCPVCHSNATALRIIKTGLTALGSVSWRRKGRIGS